MGILTAIMADLTGRGGSRSCKEWPLDGAEIFQFVQRTSWTGASVIAPLGSSEPKAPAFAGDTYSTQANIERDPARSTLPPIIFRKPGISDQNRPNQFRLTTRANAANGLLHCKW